MIGTGKADWQEVFSDGTDPPPQSKVVPGKRWGTKKEKKTAAGRLVSEGSNCCGTTSASRGKTSIFLTG